VATEPGAGVSLSPTQLSLRDLRAAGYTVAIVEHWNAFSRKRYDLFGFADLFAVRPSEVLLVQTTSSSNASARVKKIMTEPNAVACAAAGIRVHVHGWRKVGARWQCRTIDLTTDLLARSVPSVSTKKAKAK